MNRVIKKQFLFVVIVFGLFFGLTNKCRALGGKTLLADNMTGGEFEMFSQNNITFYDPNECLSTGGGSGGGGPVGILAGNDNTEKIWNYLAEANVPGVSDNAAVISAMIGNFYGETGLNPFVGGTCLGLFQVCQSSGQKEEFRQYLLQNGVTLGIKNPTEEQTNRAIQAELDFLWQKYHGTENFFANLDIVSEKSPESYAELFVVTVERAVCYPGMIIGRIGECHKISQPLNDQAIMNYVRNTMYKSGKYHTVDSYQGIANRRQYAREIYDKYAGSTSNGTSVSSFGSDNAEIDLATMTSDITLIGDSISVFSESELMKKFPNSFLNKVGSRHSTSGGMCSGDVGGLTVLDKVVNGSGTILNQHQGRNNCESVTVDSSALKENVVWALGTNMNGANESTLDSVLNKIDGRKLFLVTPFNNGAYKAETDAIAELYRNYANSHDNVYVVDWNKEVRDNVSTYILGDNVHPTTAGTELFAKLIAEAVSGSKDCTTYSGDLPQYSQGDPKWSSLPYGGSTIGKAGCGPSSLAMLVTAATGKDVLPTDIAELTNGCAYFSPCGFMGRRTNTEKVCEKYGCETMVLSDSSEETIRQALKDGWMIHLSGHGSKGDGTTNSFQSNGHYIGYYNIDENDNVMVADSAGYNNPNRRNRKMALRDAIRGRWEDGRPIMAIRGKGGNVGKNTCDVVGNYCAMDGGSDNSGGDSVAIEGGLNKEQIQALADLYNSDPTTSKSKGNCPEIVRWFMNKFTDISYVSTGHGQYTAYKIGITYNLEHGNENAPRPYAVFSTLNSKMSVATCGSCHGGKHGHTGLVLGVNGDKVLTLETYGRATYEEWPTSIMGTPTLKYPDYVYSYFGNHVNMDKLSKAIGGL